MASRLLDRAKALFRKSEPAKAPVAVRKAPSPYHAVTVVPGARACAAAQALRDRRFLSRQAPPLPLPGCDSGRCQCRYEHFDDRRKGLRRAHDLAVSIDGHDDTERRDRSKRGRRKEDGK
jgi:hypothetical protein